MPWREVCLMEEKLLFVASVLADDASMTELCESFGVSRKTGYKWLLRYRAGGLAGLHELPRAPHRVPWAIAERQAQAIVKLRRAHPSWGPKKLRAMLGRREPEQEWPAPSTIGELLRRNGLSHARKRRRHAVPNPGPLTPATSANEVWCIDFKGWFRTADHARCDPLTVSDAFSRYLLCAQVLARPDYDHCRARLERLFAEYGLPRVMRSDNGPPFACTALGGLTRLSVWWVKLGITPERIAPGKPEQNGRHERMHKTLKAETAAPPAATLAQQQRRFDCFRREFNHQRPHEALGQSTPAQYYAVSPRQYPARLEDPVYPSDYQLRRVRSNGEIKWAGDTIFLSVPLIGQIVGVKSADNGDAEVYFGPVPLAVIDRRSLTLKRSSPMGRGGQPSSRTTQSECNKVLPMLPD